MEEALGAVFPATTLQTCIVHLIRNSLDFASWKDRKLPAAALKPIYCAPSDDAATKLIWLALRNIMSERGRSIREWREAMNQFAIAYGDRFTTVAA